MTRIFSRKILNKKCNNDIIWFEKPTCFTFIFNASSGYDWVQNNEVFLTGATYSRNFRKIWILLIRPQGDWVHLFSHFKILTKNRYSTQSRKLSEGLFITISEPELNRQVIHKKCLLFCSCLSDRIPPDRAICTQSPWGLIRRIRTFRKFLEYVAPVKKKLRYFVLSHTLKMR